MFYILCSTFYTTRASETHSKALSWHESSLLPCPSAHLQLCLLPSAFCPTGVFYSDGQTWRLSAHCCSKISLYGQKKKNQSKRQCSVSGGYSLRKGEHIPGWNTINPNTRWNSRRVIWKKSSPGREVSWFHCLLQHTWVGESACIISFPKVSTMTPLHVPLLLLRLEKGQKLLERAFKRLLVNVKTNSKMLQQNSFQDF